MQSEVITTNLDGHLHPDRDSHVHLAAQLVSPLLEIIEESQEHLLTWFLLPQLLVPQPLHHALLLSAGVHNARVESFLEALKIK